MAVSVSYPGVYIQEVPSGSRAIAGVPTSIAAFVGYTGRGPVNDAVQIFSFAELGYAPVHNGKYLLRPGTGKRA